ncbi:hypothetical protein GCM10020331_042090 [Ectobacillus funiculus]
MFTGIIEEIGKVERMQQTGQAITMTISASHILSDVHLGDSIAVNGVCLTVTSFTSSAFTVDVMPETVKATSLQALGRGSSVNLERAMSAGGRFGGHFVSGHADGIGTIVEKKKAIMPFTIELNFQAICCATAFSKDLLQLMAQV